MQQQPTDPAEPIVVSPTDSTALAPRFASALRKAVPLVNMASWPEGAVRGALAIVVTAAAILGFWRGTQWNLPPTMTTLLPMVSGFVLALPSTSSLKSWFVLVMVANVVAMELWLGWSAPVLATIAVQGGSQYFATKFLMQPPPKEA